MRAVSGATEYEQLKRKKKKNLRMIEKPHLDNWNNCFCNLDAVLYSPVQSVNWSMLGRGPLCDASKMNVILSLEGL